jgi:small nuclear ribonucleoprotein F
MEYQGKLTSSDAYMNLQLTGTEEFLDGQFAGFLGEVLIRCNNILYVVAAPAQQQEEAAATTSKEAAAMDTSG